jgi:hypothetical protein
MAGGTKGLLHGATSSNQHVRLSTHGPRNEHGLPYIAQILRKAWRARPKSAGGSLSVNADLHAPSPDFVLLQLRHVVGDVIDLVEVVVANPSSQHFLEAPSYKAGEDLPVGKSEIGGRRHGTEVSLAFGRVEWSANKFAVGQFDAVLPHDLLKLADKVFAHMVS